MKYACLFLTLILALSITVTASADDTEKILPELYNSIPSEVKQSLPGSLAESVNGNSTDNGITAEYLFDTFGTMLGGAAKSAVKSLSVLICTVILTAIVNATTDTYGDSVSKTGNFLCGTSVLISLFSFLRPMKELLSSSLLGIGTLIKASFPAITAICAASGNISSSAVNGAWLTALLTLTEQLADALVSPLISICLGLLLVTAISKYTGTSDISGCLSSVKNAVTLILSLLGTILTTVMTYQSVIAKSSDSVLLRSVKFASGNFIPVVGNAVSEAASGYIAGLSVIKGSAGLITTVSLILYVLPVILKFIVARVGLDIAAIIASALGCRSEADIIRESRSILDICLAVVSLCSVIFIIAVGVFVKTVAA